MGSESQLAFAMVVLASYLAMFSAAQKTISLVEIGLEMLFGVSYITIGVYGYRICFRSKSRLILLLYFTVQILLGAGIVYIGKGSGFNGLVLLPLVGHAVVLLTPNWGLFVNGLIILAYILPVYRYTGDWAVVWSGLPTFLAGVVFIMVFTQMAVNEEKARNEVELLVNQLENANRRLRDYAVQAEELAITRERNRLAREIHDGLGHYLTAIHVQIQAARALMQPNDQPAQATMEKAQNLAEEALLDVRSSVASLRAAPGEDQPLPEVISHLAQECESSGLHTQFNVIGEARTLTPQAHLTLYRTAQEGLNNIRKHAEAHHIDITLDYSTGNSIRLTIQDDGQGANGVDGGFGLLGLQERANLLGGAMRTITSEGQGFTLEMVLPT
jgi:signal transduction histidine kinase